MGLLGSGEPSPFSGPFLRGLGPSAEEGGQPRAGGKSCLREWKSSRSGGGGGQTSSREKRKAQLPGGKRILGRVLLGKGIGGEAKGL